MRWSGAKGKSKGLNIWLQVQFRSPEEDDGYRSVHGVVRRVYVLMGEQAEKYVSEAVKEVADGS